MLGVVLVVSGAAIKEIRQFYAMWWWRTGTLNKAHRFDYSNQSHHHQVKLIFHHHRHPTLYYYAFMDN